MICPTFQAPVPQEIFEVEVQFPEAGAGDIRELQLHFLRGVFRFGGLGDILDTARRGLHHLIVGPAAFADVAVTKTQRHVLANLRDLEASQLSIAAVLRDERFRFHQWPKEEFSLVP